MPIQGKINGKKYKRTNIVASKSGDKIVAPMIYDGTTDSVFFEQWFEFWLLKLIPKYSVIIIDNASFYRKSRLRELAEQVDCEVLFLLYSPDLNPIQNFWARLKHKVREILPMHDCFYTALKSCFQLM